MDPQQRMLLDLITMHAHTSSSESVATKRPGIGRVGVGFRFAGTQNGLPRFHIMSNVLTPYVCLDRSFKASPVWPD